LISVFRADIAVQAITVEEAVLSRRASGHVASVLGLPVGLQERVD